MIIIIIVVVVVVVVIIVIIDLKGAIPDFYNLLTAPRTVSHTHVHVATSCTARGTHRALITCNMPCATWYEGTAQLLRLTELKSHLF